MISQVVQSSTSVGGVLAFLGAIALGPRLGKYDKTARAAPFLAIALTLGALGVFILWMGWFDSTQVHNLQPLAK